MKVLIYVIASLVRLQLFATILDVFVQLFAKTKQGETLGKGSRLVSGIE
ncbi:MAG: hypothetical protein PUD79_01735 [Prevotellaceae bacterium]|nr:hypothetical protein [Prevotellaceae bacterium]